MSIEMNHQKSSGDVIEVHSDGACSGNPGPGGWGAVIICKNAKQRISGFAEETTNNIMELTAVIESIKEIEKNTNDLDPNSKIIVYSDSQYVVKGATTWLKSWKKKNWTRGKKEPIKNVDLWKEMDKILLSRNIEFIWVKGHSGNKLNEEADQLAGNAITQSTLKYPEKRIIVGLKGECNDSKLGSWKAIINKNEPNEKKIENRLNKETTINSLELTAVMESLKTIKEDIRNFNPNSKITIRTYNDHIVDGATKYLKNWEKTNWQTKEGKPLKNKDLWKELSELLKEFEQNRGMGSVLFEICQKK